MPVSKNNWACTLHSGGATAQSSQSNSTIGIAQVMSTQRAINLINGYIFWKPVTGSRPVYRLTTLYLTETDASVEWRYRFSSLFVTVLKLLITLIFSVHLMLLEHSIAKGHSVCPTVCHIEIHDYAVQGIKINHIIWECNVSSYMMANFTFTSPQRPN